MSTSLPTSVKVPTSNPWIDSLMQANAQFPIEDTNLRLERGELDVDGWRMSMYAWIRVLKDIFLPIIKTLRKASMEEGLQYTIPITNEDIKLLEIAKDQIEPHLRQKLGILEKNLFEFYKFINPTPVSQQASKIPSPRNKPSNLQTSQEKSGTSDEVQQEKKTGTSDVAEKASGVELQESIYTEQPNDRLLRMVKSMSPEVLGKFADAMDKALYPPDIGKKLPGNDPLMEEIKNLNNRLMSTKVEICDKNDVSVTATSFTKDSNARIVKCIFIDLSSLHSPLSSKNASENQCLIQPLKLKIPGTYPQDSPMVLDCSSALASGNMKDEKDLTGEAIARLNRQLRTFEQPLSLEKIAKAWDICAHSIFREYAEQQGGGSFSSRYGTWKKMTDS